MLLSAYACEPGKGSEPEVGFRTLLAAASQHEVWLLTRQNNIAPIHDAIAGAPIEDRVHLVGIDPGSRALWAKRQGLLPVQMFYDLWQREAGRVAARLHRVVGFDVAHHATFASYWAPIGIMVLPVPKVLGPLGGGVDSPRGFGTVLGWRGRIFEQGRRAVRRLVTRGDRFDGGVRSVVLVQNRETARRLPAPSRVVSNATVVGLQPVPDLPELRDPTIAVVGRLIPWKAGVLAVHVLASLEDLDVRLVFFGEGPEQPRIRREAVRLGVEGRVEFAGHTPRGRLLRSVARASVVLHPALREEAGLAVAEALSLGTPVVFLDHGGPPVVRAAWPSSPAAGVVPTTPERTVQDLGRAVDGFLSRPAPIRRDPTGPTVTLGEVVLDAYREAVE